MSFGFKGLIFKTTDSQTLKDNFIIYEKWQLDLNTNVIYICMGNADSHVRMLKKSHGISPQCKKMVLQSCSLGLGMWLNNSSP
jgi:hypothetical protein